MREKSHLLISFISSPLPKILALLVAKKLLCFLLSFHKNLSNCQYFALSQILTESVAKILSSHWYFCAISRSFFLCAADKGSLIAHASAVSKSMSEMRVSSSCSFFRSLIMAFDLKIIIRVIQILLVVI